MVSVATERVWQSQGLARNYLNIAIGRLKPFVIAHD